MRTIPVGQYAEGLAIRAAEPEVSAPPNGAVGWPIDPKIALETYLTSPVLSAIGGLIAQALSGAPIDWQLPEADDAAYQEAKDRFAATRWYWGGVRVSWPEWVALAVESLEATGNAWAEVAEGMVNLLAPQYAQYVLRDGTPLLHYRPPVGNELTLPPWGEEVERGYVHTAYRSTWSVLYGMPPWIAARYSVDLDIAHRAYLRAFFQNDATPRYLVHITPAPDAHATEQDADLLADRLVEFFQRRAGQMAGRNMVISYPSGLTVRVEAMAANGDDPTYQALSRQVMQEVLMVRHVSMLHLGITEGGYRATASEQARGLVEYVLRPASRLIADLVGRALYPVSPRPQMEFALDDRDSVVALVEAAIKAAGVPVLTPDEARALLGYEPMGDNNLWRPTSMMPEGPVPEGG